MTRTPTLRALVGLTCCLALAACAPEAELTDIGDGPVDTVTTAVTGQVRTISGLPVPDANVSVGDQTTITDDRGVFTLVDVDVNAREILATAEGYGTGQMALALEDRQTTQLTIHMLETKTLTIPDGAIGGRIVGTDGVKLGFPEGSFVAADGTTVTGAVDVQYTLMNTPGSIVAAPGGMMARVEAGEEVMLESFGMIEVLLSSDGEPVEFEGEAEVDIPLADVEQFDDGEVIGLWSFDEDTGAWAIEGEGTVEDGLFRARVPHFSFWNADQVSQTTCVKGKLMDPYGEPLGRVSVTHAGVNYNGSSSTTASGDGGFCMLARRASTANISTSGRLADGTPFSWSQQAQTASTPGNCGNVQVCTDLGEIRVAAADGDLDDDGFSTWEGDCDDNDPTRSPAAVEVCDGLDQNCNGRVDDVFQDADGDGFDICVDCDDTQPNVYAGAPDVCDGIDDNNCDGVIDTRESDADEDGLSRCDGDCQDNDPNSQAACTFFEVGVASTFACGRMSDGITWCWGEDGPQTVAIAEPFSSIGVGTTFACGLDELGRAQCWGDNTHGQLDAPDVFFSEIMIGGDFACGVQTGGELLCWGNDADGRTDPVLGVYRHLSAADASACAVLGNGALRCWGQGQASGTLYPNYSFNMVAAGSSHSCAVTDAGQAICWGNNQHGQTTPPVGEFAQVGVGSTHSCGLTTDGKVECWGDNSNGQAVAPRGSFSQIGVGGDAACGIRPGGLVECWGNDAHGHLDTP